MVEMASNVILGVGNFIAGSLVVMWLSRQSLRDVKYDRDHWRKQSSGWQQAYDELKAATWHNPDEPDVRGAENSHAGTLAMARKQSVAYCMLADFTDTLDDEVWPKVEEKPTNE